MSPEIIGIKYDKIANWWHERHEHSEYGVPQIEKALNYSTGIGNALDVGCGAGGRCIRLLENHNFKITGIDVSVQMINLAKANHPEIPFHVADICDWNTTHKYDFILAWDSIFHLPLDRHKLVLDKICTLLNKEGVLCYTFGNAIGEDSSMWHNDEFYYSSIGINENLNSLMKNGLTVIHLELDQYPERHVFAIAKKS